MDWNLHLDSECRRVYRRETKRGVFRLLLVRGSAGFAWRVLRGAEGYDCLGRKLVRMPNDNWDAVEGISFVAAENLVVPELEQLAAVGEA